MKNKKQCVAMLLAGGQGSRLGILTANVAKPAVPFGGKYRIIDFPLCNCANSGIDVVGVLTQYQPLELNAYIGSGSPWDLDLAHGGVYRAAPLCDGQVRRTGTRGTANAIYQNIQLHRAVRPGLRADPLAATTSTRWTITRCCQFHIAEQRRLHHRRPRGAVGRGHPLRHHEHQRGQQHLRI